jgi:hypothetical protein
MTSYSQHNSEPPFVSFPQADDIWRVIDIVRAASNQTISESTVATDYQIAPRQAKYYLDAGRYLGLIQINSNGYCATAEGREITELSTELKRKKLQSVLGERPVFYEISQRIHDSGKDVQSEAADIVAQYHPGLSRATQLRRAQCAIAWIKAIYPVKDEYK